MADSTKFEKEWAEYEEKARQMPTPVLISFARGWVEDNTTTATAHTLLIELVNRLDRFTSEH